MDDQTRFGLFDGMELAGVGVRDVWWRYVALGGRADLKLLTEIIHGAAECDNEEHDLIAQVLNEIFYDHGMDTFPVGYQELYRPLPASTHVGRQPVPELLASDPCRRAAQARRDSAEAARQAAELHLTAARLMHASGQLRLANRAHARAISAFVRSRRIDVRQG